MIKRLYPILSAVLALLIADQAYYNMDGYLYNLPMSPYAYRPLVGLVWDVLSNNIGDYVATWLLWFVCLSLMAFLIDEIGKGTNETRLILLAVLVVTPSMIFLQASGALWNAIEVVFYAAAILMIRQGRTWLLYPLVILATLNRETAVFIPLVFLFITRNWKHTAGMLLLWIVTYGSIRLIVGSMPDHVSLLFILEVNLTVGFGRFVMGFGMVFWLLWYAYKGWKIAPADLKRAAYIIPLYLAAVAVFGIWHEWRLLISLYPLLVPLAGRAIEKREPLYSARDLWYSRDLSTVGMPVKKEVDARKPLGYWFDGRAVYDLWENEPPRIVPVWESED